MGRAIEISTYVASTALHPAKVEISAAIRAPARQLRGSAAAQRGAAAYPYG